MNGAELEQYLHTHIPISRAMDITVATASIEMVELRAALEPNVNHRSTAFGGSVAAVAVLAGWSLLRLNLDDHMPVPQIVIQRSVVDYASPVRTDFGALCMRPSPERWHRFMQAFTRRGRGRITLVADVRCEGESVGAFTGEFVAMKSA